LITEIDIGKLYGLLITKEGQIIAAYVPNGSFLILSLIIGNNNLNGTIPYEMAYLVNLEELSTRRLGAE
jgi:hypothetical protein